MEDLSGLISGSEGTGHGAGYTATSSSVGSTNISGSDRGVVDLTG